MEETELTAEERKEMQELKFIQMWERPTIEQLERLDELSRRYWKTKHNPCPQDKN